MEMDSVKRYRMILWALFGIACAVYLIIVDISGIDTEVMRDRFRNADALFNGEAPVTEYPPFALVFMIIPRLFASTPFSYNIAYVIEVFVFFMIGLIFISKLAARFGKDEKKAMLAYSVLMLLMFQFVVDRYDIFPVVITLISFYCFTTKRYAWAFALLSIATLTKLYPAVLFPVYLIPFMMDRKWMDALKGTAAFVITALAVVVPVILVEPDMIMHFLEYHADRPLHIESTAASFIYPFAMFGMTDVWIEYSFGSDNLLGAWPDAVAPLLSPLMVMLIVVSYVMFGYLYKKNENQGERDVLLGIAILIVLMIFMIFGKVFSSQYLMWIIPPIGFMFMTFVSEKEKKNILIMMVLAIVVTQINFAYNIGYLGGGVNINDIGMMILLLRNVLMIVFLYLTVRIVYDRYLRKDCAESDGSSE
jgi:Protein of unknown function (DUF2029).